MASSVFLSRACHRVTKPCAFTVAILPATPASAGWREALERSSRHRNARNLDPHPPQFTISGDKQGGPILPAKAQVGHMLVTGEDGSQGLARAINNPDAPGSGAIHVPFRIHLHAV